MGLGAFTPSRKRLKETQTRASDVDEYSDVRRLSNMKEIVVIFYVAFPLLI